MSAAEVVFWSALALLAYVYAGYPLLVTLAARRRPPVRVEGEVLPRVTVVIAAHDEAARIRERLENVLAQDYPADRLNVLIGSDGSRDGTVEAARALRSARVSIVAFAFRRGKAACLNDLIARASGDIVVLADARQQFAPDAVRRLVVPFADPTVGAVGGELLLRPAPGSPVGEGVGAYWRYEKHIRRMESRLDSTVGATGAIYAIRRRLYTPVPHDTVLDDVLIPMQVARQGYRVLFEGAARAFDGTPARGRDELARKARTLAGLFQLLRAHRWLLSPRQNRLWLQTVSHKALRLGGPLLLAAMLAASVAGDGPVLRLALAGQAAFYMAGAAGGVLRSRGRAPRVLALPWTFCLLNLAVCVGFWRFLRGTQRVTWERPGTGAPAAGSWSPVRSRRAVRS
jgi:cellulose synthase/poly-beta-1,6-N-acetylglucosamine synthase-like glycosyltransferase